MKRLALVGIAAICLGVLTLLNRGVAGLFDIGYLVVSALGVLAAVGGARYALARRGRKRRPLEIDSPEPRYRSPVPGKGFDRTLARSQDIGSIRDIEIRSHLRSLAVDALVSSGRYGRQGAQNAVERGDWTDDEVAAGYLAVPTAVPRRVTLGSLLRRQSTTQVCVRRTLTAIEEVTNT